MLELPSAGQTREAGLNHRNENARVWRGGRKWRMRARKYRTLISIGCITVDIKEQSFREAL